MVLERMWVDRKPALGDRGGFLIFGSPGCFNGRAFLLSKLSDVNMSCEPAWLRSYGLNESRWDQWRLAGHKVTVQLPVPLTGKPVNWASFLDGWQLIGGIFFSDQLKQLDEGDLQSCCCEQTKCSKKGRSIEILLPCWKINSAYVTIIAAFFELLRIFLQIILGYDCKLV